MTRAEAIALFVFGELESDAAIALIRYLTKGS